MDKNEKFRSIKSNPMLTGLSRITENIVYSKHGMVLRVILPWKCEANAGVRYPLILFIQGSAWTSPDMTYEIPQLSWYASQGYTVATVTHRNCMDGFPFPTFLQDVKCALRFLRAHADEFSIDKERVVVFGTSSGGNTSLLLGLTGDDPRYKTDEYADQSDSVSAVVECFGPTDMLDLHEFYKAKGGEPELLQNLLGGSTEEEEVQKKAREMSPLLIAEKGKVYPPTLILHGDRDSVVPYETQAVRMFDRLDELGCNVSLVRVEGAEHEGDFWSRELHDIILGFINSHTK